MFHVHALPHGGDVHSCVLRAHAPLGHDAVLGGHVHSCVLCARVYGRAHVNGCHGRDRVRDGVPILKKCY